MEKIVYFDYAAIVILGVLIVSFITRKMLKGRLNRDFLFLVVTAFLTTIFDVYAVAFDRFGDNFYVGKYVFHTLYLLFHSCTLPFYLIFVIGITGSAHKTTKNPSYKILMALPLEFEVFMLALNLFRHVVFHFDENGTYVRGSFFWVNYVVALFYLVAAVIHLIHYRKTLQAGRFASIFIMIPAIILAVAVQFVFPELLIESFVISICSLYVCLVVIRPEENIDSETGLLRLPAYVDTIRKAEITKRHMVFVFIDISNFRTLNRSLGYRSSSSLFLEVAKMISEECQNNRIHAEYYYIGEGKYRLIVENNDRPLVPEFAKTIQKKLSDGFTFREIEISLLANVSVAHWPENLQDEKGVMLFGGQFDELNYRQGVIYAKEIMSKKNFDILKDLDGILEDALTTRKFEVYYQPIYSLKKKRFTTAEALIRLKTEEHGFIPPDLFIPVAEQNGTIHRIGRFVVEEVCRFIASDEFKDLQIDVIDVNLSAIQCLEKNLAREISMILGTYNIRPEQINLEITETAAAFEQNEMLTNIENLSARGFHFSLDDYGTGYSNISRAIEMPLSVVKLDKSITKIDENTKFYAIGMNTIRMIKDMNMDIVAEGIEDEETLRKFEEMGCDYIQGFYFSKPLPKDEFIQFIHEQLKKQEEQN
ncbi:MAG: EAL domain-containing protein [Lachnospiraceae bacterium]|nr:EAL domain-containing protein [Lachnospiraceae bacterium]